VSFTEHAVVLVPINPHVAACLLRVALFTQEPD
jgi:hypothetical protein